MASPTGAVELAQLEKEALDVYRKCKNPLGTNKYFND
jgi:hypothetical protein